MYTTTNGQIRKRWASGQLPTLQNCIEIQPSPLVYTFFPVATNLTLYGKFLLSPETLCSQNTKLDKSVFLVAFSLAKLANEFADFKDTSSDMKEDEHWVH